MIEDLMGISTENSQIRHSKITIGSLPRWKKTAMKL